MNCLIHTSWRRTSPDNKAKHNYPMIMITRCLHENYSSIWMSCRAVRRKQTLAPCTRIDESANLTWLALARTSQYSTTDDFQFAKEWLLLENTRHFWAQDRLGIFGTSVRPSFGNNLNTSWNLSHHRDVKTSIRDSWANPAVSSLTSWANQSWMPSASDELLWTSSKTRSQNSPWGSSTLNTSTPRLT